MTLPRSEPKPLEPWALELLRQGQPGGDPINEQELARLVALLRSLPDPERSPDLAQRILAHVSEQSAGSRVVYAWLGRAHRVARPAVAAMLAAGIAALFAYGISPESVSSLLRASGGEGSDGSHGDVTDSGHVVRRRPSVVIRPQYVSAMLAQAPAAPPRFLRVERSPMDDAFDARLDHQLNQLMIDPNAFAERLEQVAQRDLFIARLAQRAAERGDAPEIALRVRESSHPLATVLVDRLLRATLVASASTH